jgi:hypothetical protein
MATSRWRRTPRRLVSKEIGASATATHPSTSHATAAQTIQRNQFHKTFNRISSARSRKPSPEPLDVPVEPPPERQSCHCGVQNRNRFGWIFIVYLVGG